MSMSGSAYFQLLWAKCCVEPASQPRALERLALSGHRAHGGWHGPPVHTLALVILGSIFFPAATVSPERLSARRPSPDLQQEGAATPLLGQMWCPGAATQAAWMLRTPGAPLPPQCDTRMPTDMAKSTPREENNGGGSPTGLGCLQQAGGRGPCVCVGGVGAWGPPVPLHVGP